MHPAHAIHEAKRVIGQWKESSGARCGRPKQAQSCGHLLNCSAESVLHNPALSTAPAATPPHSGQGLRRLPRSFPRRLRERRTDRSGLSSLRVCWRSSRRLSPWPCLGKEKTRYCLGHRQRPLATSWVHSALVLGYRDALVKICPQWRPTLIFKTFTITAFLKSTVTLSRTLLRIKSENLSIWKRLRGFPDGPPHFRGGHLSSHPAPSPPKG